MTKTVKVSWLAKQNIVIDESMEELYKLYQYDLTNELLCGRRSQLMKYLLEQPIALEQKVKGSYWLANNFGLLVLMNKPDCLKGFFTQQLEVIKWRSVQSLKVNLINETLNILALISMSRSKLCHAKIFKVLKEQLSEDEWLRFHGKNKFLIKDYLDWLGISQSTFDRSRGGRT